MQLIDSLARIQRNVKGQAFSCDHVWISISAYYVNLIIDFDRAMGRHSIGQFTDFCNLSGFCVESKYIPAFEFFIATTPDKQYLILSQDMIAAKSVYKALFEL